MKNNILAVKAFFLICALWFCAGGAAGAPPSPPKEFRSGVYVNRIDNFDVKTGTAEVDFWYWMISDGDTATLQNLELNNGRIEPIEDAITQKRDGKCYISRRYLAKVQCRLDLSKFPFDKQRVCLSFEDDELTSDKMVFVPDVANSGIDPNFQMNEWDIERIDYQIGVHKYPSSFGYLDIPSGQGSDYSQFDVIVTLSRRGSFAQKMFKYFWTFIVSVIVGLSALLIRVCDLSARFSMTVGALFANVGCLSLLAEKIPKSPDVSLAESVSYISLGLIMIFLVESIISLNIYNRGRQKLSRIMDCTTFALSLVCYGGMWLFI